MLFTKKALFVCAASASLLACNGGGSSDNAEPNDHLSNITKTIVTRQINQKTIYSTDAGRAIYVIDPTTENAQQECDAQCEQVFPPLLADAQATPFGDFGLLLRADGVTQQWALLGKPLHVYSGDKALDDTNGEMREGRWFTAKPLPVTIKSLSTQNFSGEALIGQHSVQDTNGSGLASANYINIDNSTFYTMPLGVSCVDVCAETWRPIFVSNGMLVPSPYTVLSRADGSRQLASGPNALYRFASNPIGDAGQGLTTPIGNFNVTWNITRPQSFQLVVGAAGPYYAAAHSIANVGANGEETTTRSNKHGFALYIFDEDPSYASNCTDQCAVIWPPLFADNFASTQGNFSVIERPDGSRQWALNTKPLYLYSGDVHAQSTRGDGANNNQWHLARPVPFQLSGATATESHWVAQGLFSNVNLMGGLANTSTDKSDFFVYRFDDDGQNISNCNGACAVTWPPIFAEKEGKFGDFAVFLRADGSKQWSYKGSPLYFFRNDSIAGEMNGVYGTWHLVKP